MSFFHFCSGQHILTARVGWLEMLELLQIGIQFRSDITERSSWKRRFGDDHINVLNDIGLSSLVFCLRGNRQQLSRVYSFSNRFKLEASVVIRDKIVSIRNSSGTHTDGPLSLEVL